MRAAAGRIEADSLLALTERFSKTAEVDERSSAVAAARGAVGAQYHGAVVLSQRLTVAPLLIALVPRASDFLKITQGAGASWGVGGGRQGLGLRGRGGGTQPKAGVACRGWVCEAGARGHHGLGVRGRRRGTGLG